MKQKIRFFLLALLTATTAWADVQINEENFPDEVFRSMVLEHDYDENGILTDDEIANIISINISPGTWVKSLKGIEFFTALETLSCGDKGLTELDLTKNTALTQLLCYNNQLTVLDLSQNTALTYLNCSENQLTVLDLSQNTELTILYCSENQLTELNLSKNTALTMLYCYSNQLTGLEVSNNIKLTELDCSYNQLTCLDASECNSIKRLYCQHNQLTSLLVSKDASSMVELYCYQNLIRGNAMDALVERMPTVRNGRMYVIYDKDEQNEMTTVQVAAAKEKGWKPCNSNNGYWYDYKGVEPPPVGVAVDEANFPDERFRGWLLNRPYGKDGILTDEEIAGITKMDVSHQQIKSLKGIGYFTALTELDCHLNYIKGAEMDSLTESLPSVSNGSLKVKWEYDEHNIMSTKQVAAAKAKGWEAMYYWASISRWLEYTGCPVIDEETFPDENFRRWALSQQFGWDGVLSDSEIEGITSIYVSGWGIKSMKGLEHFRALKELYCSQNSIRGAEMDALVEYLPTVLLGYMYIIYPGLGKNEMTTSQVEAAKEKGWKACFYNRYYSGWREYVGIDPQSGDVPVDEEHFPDANFRQWLYHQIYSTDGVVKEAEIEQVGNIIIIEQNVQTLKGIEYFTDLQSLTCYSNQLTELDVSKNKALKYLTCTNNQLTELDLSGLTELLHVECEINRLTSLNVSGCTAMTLLHSNGNRLEWLDVSGCTALEELTCYNNQLTSADLSGCTSMKYFDCSQNEFSGVRMDALIERLPVVPACTMHVIRGNNDHNTMTTAQVSAAKAKGWVPRYLDDVWKEYKGCDPVLAIDEKNFPDPNFRQCLLEHSFGTDSVVTNLELPGVRMLSATGKNIKSMKGIDLFPELTFLGCNNNQLTELDLSKNPKLEILNCTGNQLTELDLSKNTALEDLLCSKNQLTELDLTKNQCLEHLECHSNQLTKLDLSQNTELNTLNCHSNLLTGLDLSQNIRLKTLDCHRNRIRGNAMDALVESLPNVNQGWLYTIWNESEQNEMTLDQAATAKAKGWTAYYYYDRKWQEFDFDDEDGISSPPAVSSNKGKVYDISGRRLSKPQRGLNIIGGKKMVK